MEESVLQVNNLCEHTIPQVELLESKNCGVNELCSDLSSSIQEPGGIIAFLDEACVLLSQGCSLLWLESSRSSKFSSIGSRFKQQMQTLVETLNATEPHHICCLKPNNLLKAAIFENSNALLQQLRCGGVMEAMRISCAGFSPRRTFENDEMRDNDCSLADCKFLRKCSRINTKPHGNCMEQASLLNSS
ncbi:hypothetical protein NE237_022569 [Protea cynaroides]|uniref:Myosin motor domain-containing protein n=1 Tax=Protea cynaroides TaxID=273540 RepID=A0A9Q0K5E6_9MAGN|nr:hypothetical protein NE237_022569 [Protea cynaroides]